MRQGEDMVSPGTVMWANDITALRAPKPQSGAGCLWRTPVIPATHEAKIRRIAVQSQPRKIVHKTQSQKNPSQKGLVEWLKV
jgi:hypothetical protein